MQEVKTLKLNVNNIKSILIKGNADLRKIRSQEKSFLSGRKREAQKMQKEKFVENKLGSSKIASGAKKIMAPAMGFLDKIKEFFSLVLLGIIVNNLPQAIKKVQDFIKDSKWLFDAIKAVFASLEFVVPLFKEIVKIFNPAKQEEYEKTKEDLKAKLNALTGNIDALDKEAGAVEKELKEELDEQPDEPINRTDDELKVDIKSAIKDQKITQKEFNRSLNDYRTSINNNKKTAEPIQVPGVGSYERTSGGLLGMGTKVVTKDTFGREITPETFDERVLTAVEQNKGESFKDDFLKLAQGGLVRQGATGQEKVAMRDAESFLNLKESALISSRVLDQQGENNNQFKKLTENYETYLDLTKGDDDISSSFLDRLPPNSQGPQTTRPSSTSPYSVPPGAQGPTIPSPPTTSTSLKGGGYVTQRNDPDRQDTGIDIALKDSNGDYNTGAIIQNPFKSLEITSTGEQINPDGSGFGNYVTGTTFIDGKKYELLIGHLDTISVNKGQILGSGQTLGTQGTTGSATGPHVTTHINALDGGNPQEILNNVENAWVNGVVVNSTLTPKGGGKIKPKQIIPVPEGLLEPLTPYQKQHFSGGKDGGLRRSEQLTQTFDGEGATEVIIINSTQPIIIPGPTRYIRR